MDCLELSRLLREAEMKVAAKMAAEQKGELFDDDLTETEPTKENENDHRRFTR